MQWPVSLRLNINYLFIKSEVFRRKYQIKTLLYWPSDSKVNIVRYVLRFSCRDQMFEVNKLLSLCFSLWFYRPLISPWALQENAWNKPIRACVISATNIRHIIMKFITSKHMWKSSFLFITKQRPFKEILKSVFRYTCWKVSI